MTKAELAKMFAEATQQPITQAKEDLERLGDIMAAELLGGGEIPLTGVGKLVIKQRAARQGRNPRTGETLAIAEKKVLGVTMTKDFEASLN